MNSIDPVSIYRSMITIRRFEERVLQLSHDGQIAGSVHLCVGQEAIPVGAAAALRPKDRVLATYRGHGWALALGSDPLKVLAEIAQRRDGLNGGRAGSAMLSDPDNGFLGENSIVGAGYPIAAGVALAAVRQGEDRVVISSVGDGAINQGATMEGLAFAAALKLPVIFICENNGWSEMTPIHQTTRTSHLATRAAGFGIAAETLDGDDPVKVRDAVESAIATCAAGEGPVFLEFKTHRLGGHYNRDIQHYRDPADIELAAARDPIIRLRDQLIETGRQREVEQTEHSVDEHLDSIVASVLAMPTPDPETALDHVNSLEEKTALATLQGADAKEITYQRAINLALAHELEQRPELIVYGEDVGFAGGIFGVTRSLQKNFGADRVFDTPISESAILGSAVGAAMDGLRPVVEIMWADFVFVALDQVVNQAANVRYINRSRLSAPLTIRTQQGVTPGSCAQHSQSIEAILAHVPGLKVGLPSTPQDAYAMTRAAIADDDPTVLIESRVLYQSSGILDPSQAPETASGARFHARGGDLAIITWGHMLDRAVAAAGTLRNEGIEATVLDLRWLRPLDEESIAEAVALGSGRVLVAHEAIQTGGFGAEVAARITESHWNVLQAPVMRVGMPDTRVPSAPSLQEAVVPSAKSLVRAARFLVGRPLAEHLEHSAT